MIVLSFFNILVAGIQGNISIVILFYCSLEMFPIVWCSVSVHDSEVFLQFRIGKEVLPSSRCGSASYGTS